MAVDVRLAMPCDCPWPDGEDELTPEMPCGCGTELVRLYRDSTWHWGGQHWRAACLIDALARSLDQLADAIAPTRRTPEDRELWETEDGTLNVEALVRDVRDMRESTNAECERLKEENRDLARSLDEVRGQLQWQPIATAPKDGSEVLLTDGKWKRTGYWARRIERWSVDAVVPLSQPTHWMPLPPAPIRSGDPQRGQGQEEDQEEGLPGCSSGVNRG